MPLPCPSPRGRGLAAEQAADDVGAHAFAELAAVAVDEILAALRQLAHHARYLGRGRGKLDPACSDSSWVARPHTIVPLTSVGSISR